MTTHIPRSVCLLLCLVPVTVAIAKNSSGGRPSTAGPCITRSDAYISAADLGPFTQFLRATFYTSPFAGFAPPGARLAWITDFIISGVRGYLANVTLKGLYRRLEDKRARALHYQVGKWPLVPFQGRVVTDHPGILEVYQSNFAFRSTKAARMVLRSNRNSGDGVQGDVARPFPAHFGDDTFALKAYPPPGSQREWHVNLVVRLGTSVVALSIAGGRRITAAQGVHLMRIALRHVARSCDVKL